MSVKQEPQCCTHYPFMSSDNWLNNTSFYFYKVDKSHRGHCHGHGLRHAPHSSSAWRQLSATWAASWARWPLSWRERRNKSGTLGGRERKQAEREEGSPLLSCFTADLPPEKAKQSWALLPPQQLLGLEGLCPPCPTKSCQTCWSGVQLRNVLYLIILQHQPPSGKWGVSLLDTCKWATLIYFPHDYTHFPLQIQMK